VPRVGSLYLASDSPLAPPGEYTHQIWTETRLSLGRPAIEPFGVGLQSMGPTWFINARGGTTFGP
jgi:hypothetical protein